MTVKEELHRLVDQLPEIEDLRAAAEADDEPLDPETLESLDRGLADIRAGRVKPLEQYERERGL
jgi:hypothetical protein